MKFQLPFNNVILLLLLLFSCEWLLLITKWMNLLIGAAGVAIYCTFVGPWTRCRKMYFANGHASINATVSNVWLTWANNVANQKPFTLLIFNVIAYLIRWWWWWCDAFTTSSSSLPLSCQTNVSSVCLSIKMLCSTEWIYGLNWNVTHYITIQCANLP